MLIVTKAHANIEEGDEEHRGGTGYRFSLYLTMILTGSFFALFSVFPLAKNDYFNKVSRRTFWHAMDYHAHMRGQNCDVVIFGDSTAATGIDPLIIEQYTGLKTCNLALPYMALATTGTTVLDQYLKFNSAPKLIIFGNHARHLRTPRLDEDPGVIDGWLMADRAMPAKQASLLFLRHPKLSLLFAEFVWQQVLTLSPALQPDLSMRTYSKDMTALETHNGYFTMPVTEPPEQICAAAMPDSYIDPGYLPALRQRYERKNTVILLYADPVRDCDRKLGEYRHLAALLSIEPPMVFTVDKFADAWHLDRQGAIENSCHVSRLISTTLADRQGGELHSAQN